jgi:hypothetical protein
MFNTPQEASIAYGEAKRIAIAEADAEAAQFLGGEPCQ